MKTIFVSSTFRDMDLERDMIQQQVYPRLNKLARPHGQSISFCDLRWGIDTSLLESESGSRKVLDVCLDEIDRCQPPMVVILGYRYGWIPSQTLVEATANRYALNLDDLEKSVTALEIEYGALADPARLKNTLFYFREIQGTPPADFLPEDAAHAARLETLKNRIRQLTGDRVRTYTLRGEQDQLLGAEAFADMLCQDLAEILQPQWDLYDTMTPFQKELQTHENYMQEKAAVFRARKDLAQQVLDQIAQGQTLTILQGAVGSGKSTLLSYLALQLQQQGWNTLTLFSNLTTQTGTATDILKLTVSYLEQVLGMDTFSEDSMQERNLDNPDVGHLKSLVGADAQTGDFGVKQWQERLNQLCTLYEKTGKKLVILVDAIDQLFPDEARDALVFLPAALGEHVRFLMTCLPEVNVQGNSVTPIAPISGQDKRHVIQGILETHNRELSAQVTDAMVLLPGSDNPLYLSFLVQRLMMMNKQDFDAIRRQGDGMDAITHHQLAVLQTCPQQLDAMSVELMDTAAARIDSAMVLPALNFLALSPHGLRSTDLAALLGDSFNMLDFAHFISYMNDCFVIRNDGRYDFSHKSIREGLQHRCQTPQTYHRQLLDHFIGLDPEDDIRRQEIVYHCIHADDKAYYVRYIQDCMWEDDVAIDYAAKVTYAAVAQDEGKWLTAVLDQGKALGAQRYLIQFIYKHFDRKTSTRPDELRILKRIYESNGILAHTLAKETQGRKEWVAMGFSLEILSDVKEALGTVYDLVQAQRHRKDQLKISKKLHEVFHDKFTLRNVARTHQNLAANMQLHENEDVSKTREHLAKALELRQQLAQTTGEETDQDELGQLYIKLAKNYSGWLHRDNALALEYTKNARELYQSLYDTTGNTKYLLQLADIYALLAKIDDFSPDVEDIASIQGEWYQKQLQVLEGALQRENTILHRQLLAAAYLHYVQAWFVLENEKSIAYCRKAVNLYRSIVRERGTVDDLRNLSQALYATYWKLTNAEIAEGRAILQEAISIRQEIYDKLGIDTDQTFLAALYHTIAPIQEDPAEAERCRAKAEALGYVDKRKVYSEVLEILRHMDKAYVDLIPKDVVLFLYDNCDLEYDFRMTKPLSEEELSPHTLQILSVLLQGFWQDGNFTMGDVRMNQIFGRL